MGRLLRAFVATFLLIEIAGLVIGTSVWAILAEFHASNPVIIGAEGLAMIGVTVLGVVIFRRALAAETRIDTGEPSA